MSATSALAAAPNEPQVELKNEPEAAREVAAETAAEVRAEAAAAESPQEQALTPALSQGERKEVAERILQAEGLPLGMRERLAHLAAASGEGKLPVEDVVKAIEESLPEFLRADRAGAAQRPHPAGEVYFRGDSESLSDEEATQIAQRQLARSGLLRGQRVRVGD
jgi:hypothetical protein